MTSVLLGPVSCASDDPPVRDREAVPDSSVVVTDAAASADAGGGPADAAADAASADGDPSAAVFDTEVIHSVEIEMDPGDWEGVRSGDGWRQGTVRWDGEVVDGVGLRAFGYGSFNPDKPNLKIGLDHFERGREWRGLEQIKLDNSTQDPTFLHERIGTAIHRRFGVPAARTGWAALSVNGVALGFYVVLEAVDDVFLERWFGDGDGILYDTVQGAWGHGLMPLDDPLAYYNPQTSAKTDGSDLVALTEIVAVGSDDDLVAFLDLDEFLRESVARSAMGSVDSFSSDGNNFYLYDDGGYWRIIPWDLDYDFAGRVDLREPWAASPWAYDSLTGEAYADPVLLRQIERGADVDALAAELVGDAMSCAVVDGEIVRSADLIREAVNGDPLGYGPGFDEAVEGLRLFVREQVEWLGGQCPGE